MSTCQHQHNRHADLYHKLLRNLLHYKQLLKKKHYFSWYITKDFGFECFFLFDDLGV